MDFLFIALVFGLFVVSVTGRIFPFLRKGKELSADFIALGAGAMVAVSLVHVFPEAIEMDHRAAFAFLAGFFLVYLLENFIAVHVCVEDDCHYHHLGILSWVSITFHTLLDGVAIGASFATDRHLGLLVLFWVAIHQLPVSTTLWSLLSKMKKKGSFKEWTFLSFALSAPIGAVLGNTFFTGIGESVLLACVLAMAGGSLLYVGASDLLPNVHRNSKNRALVVMLFALGALVVSFGTLLE